MKRLFVDDVRAAPDDSWTVVRDVESAIKYIRQFLPHTISLDHDAGDTGTFMPLVYFIGEKYQNDTFWADDLGILIHSDNPVGAQNIQNVLEEYGVLDVQRV